MKNVSSGIVFLCVLFLLSADSFCRWCRFPGAAFSVNSSVTLFDEEFNIYELLKDLQPLETCGGLVDLVLQEVAENDKKTVPFNFIKTLLRSARLMLERGDRANDPDVIAVIREITRCYDAVCNGLIIDK